MVKNLSRFSRYLTLMFILILSTSIVFYFYVRAEKNLDKINNLRLQSFLLTQELNDSSDNLTRMVRTYVTTGDATYKDYFYEILAIRDGTKPRPVDYGHNYWALVQKNTPRPSPDGQTIPLLTLMKQAGFSATEFSLLEQAKINSDALARTEFAAMALIEGKQPVSDSVRLKAATMLFDEHYQEAKINIMQPIGQLTKKVEQRTNEAVQHAENIALSLRYLFIMLCLLLLITVRLIYNALQSLLGCSITELHQHLERLGLGDFSKSIAVKPQQKNSILAWVSKTQQNLMRSENYRQQMEETLKASEARFKILFDKAPVGIALIDSLTGQIYNVNSKYAEIVGLTVDKLQTLDWMKITHPDDVQADLDNMALMNSGQTNGFVMEKRYIHANGSIVWINLTVAKLPIQQQGHPCHHCIVEDITERKQVEEALRQSEECFQTMFRTHSAVMLLINPESGQIIDANYAAEQFYGYPLHKLIGMSISSINQSSKQTVVAARLQAVEQKKNVFEFSHQLANGEMRNVEVHSTPIIHDNSTLLFSVIHDISERKRAEQQLREKEYRLNEAERIAQFGNWGLDFSTNTLIWSDGIFLIFEIDKTQFSATYEGFLAAIHPDDREVVNAAYTESLQTRKPYNITHRLLMPDGRIKYVQEQCETHFDPEGKPIRSIGTVQDVTERTHAEQQLRESEEKLRAIFELANIGIAIVDTQGHFIMSNQWWLDKLGYDKDEVKNLTKMDITYPEDREPSRVYFAELLAGKIDKYQIEKRFVRKDQTIFWSDLSASAIKDKNNEISAVVTVITDITERKQAEAELRIAAIAFEAQEGMIVTDANQCIIRVNQAFTDITGYTAEESIGKNSAILRSDRQNEEFYTALWQCLNDTGTWQGEIWDRRKNGEIYPEYLTITAVKDPHGNITHYVATFNDITSIRAAADEIEHLAFYDPLTKLPNRRLLQERLKQALAASYRNSLSGGLFFIDIDNFKNLNDTLGHEIGDLLLIQVAERLLSCVRENDTVARFGGDEFIVLLEDLENEIAEAVVQAETVGKKILFTLNQPYPLKTHQYHSTPSIGAVLFKGYEQSVDELLKQADIAMYQAKASGRNGLRFFNQQMQATIMARTAMQKDLQIALEESQFELYYQAQVDQNHQITGSEALIRWQHPERGLIFPDAFIPLAEETDLILPIGRWILEAACVQLKIWAGNQQSQHLHLSVNVSARQFRHPEFVAQVLYSVNHHGINPNKLKLELTESLAIDNLEETIDKMNILRKVGIKFSMDDFGTGYSSLSCLKKLPIEQLKIDQSFVRDISTDPDNAAIVQTIIAMAKNLGLKVIAEGVETEAQCLFLEQHGCQNFQGYLFSKPVPIEQFELLMLNSR